MAMRGPTQDEPTAAQLECDVGALGGSEPGGQIADEGQAGGGALELLATGGAGGGTERRGGRGPRQQGSANARGRIELGGFAHPPRLRLPEGEPGAHALGQADYQEAEHGHDDDHFEQSEPALPGAGAAVHRRTHRAVPAVPRRNVLSTTDRAPSCPGHEIATSTLNKVVVADDTPSCANDCREVSGETRSAQR